LPDVIAELAKHATKRRLSPRDAERVITVGIGRHRFGNHPDATLIRLVDLDGAIGEPRYDKAVTALRERNPETEEAADSIVNDIEDEYLEAQERGRLVETEREAERQQAENILDGPPPVLPPPIAPPEPQKLETGTSWAETQMYRNGVANLLCVRTKPSARFTGMFSPAELHEVADFLRAVASAAKAKAEAA